MKEETLFAAVLQQSPGSRPRFMEQACAADPALLQRMQALLAAHDKAVGILEHPVQPNLALGTAEHPPFDLSPVTEQTGTMIGTYKLLQQLGEGGMGVVYMAEQEHPIRRRVALKIIKPGMD